MTRSRLYLLAGGNGAGKSTFYRQQLAVRNIPFVNADEIAKELPASATRDQQAWQQASDLRDRWLSEGINFAYETVFSHPSKLDVIRSAQTLGYEVILIYIHLTDPNLNLARVKNGHQAHERHDVPEDKILSRLPKLQAHMGQAIKLADEVLVYDNSSALAPYRLVARFTSGHPMTAEIPDWLSKQIR